MSHLPPIHHETNKHDSPNETKIKKNKTKRPAFEFKHRQVNDPSQSNQRTDHLVSQLPKAVWDMMSAVNSWNCLLSSTSIYLPTLLDAWSPHSLIKHSAQLTIVVVIIYFA
jgi:hypothetical protein